jgi:hypothetical protein
MICGDLDLDRAERDAAYLRLMRAFLVWGEHRPLRRFGFPDLRRDTVKVAVLRRRSEPATPSRQRDSV